METNYAKCDGCGSYHPESEMEIVVLKLRKGSKCALGALEQPKTTLATPQPIQIPKIANPNAPTINGKPLNTHDLKMIAATEATKL